jgi:hypothetical protein
MRESNPDGPAMISGVFYKTPNTKKKDRTPEIVEGKR